MSDQTSGQLEHEAEKIRANIAQTAEAIQDRMSPGKIVDELMGYLKGSDGSVALDNLRRQARDNPMALAMIGSGAAWLMFGGGGSSTSSSAPFRQSGIDPYAAPFGASGGVGRSAEGRSSLGGEYYPDTSHSHDSSGLTDKASDYARRTQEAAGSAAETVQGAVEGVKEQLHSYAQDASATGRRAAESLRDYADSGRQSVSHAAESVRDYADTGMRSMSDAAQSVRSYADSGRRSVMDALDREPLVLGAIGLAVGAALGAMLPGTRFEDETFGKTRDGLVRDASRAVDRAAETAQHVASEALAAARTASEEEGLTIEGKPVLERLGDVAKAALAAGEEAVEQKTDVADASADRPISSNDDLSGRV